MGAKLKTFLNIEVKGSSLIDGSFTLKTRVPNIDEYNRLKELSQDIADSKDSPELVVEPLKQIISIAESLIVGDPQGFDEPVTLQDIKSMGEDHYKAIMSAMVWEVMGSLQGHGIEASKKN